MFDFSWDEGNVESLSLLNPVTKVGLIYVISTITNNSNSYKFNFFHKLLSSDNIELTTIPYHSFLHKHTLALLYSTVN